MAEPKTPAAAQKELDDSKAWRGYINYAKETLEASGKVQPIAEWLKGKPKDDFTDAQEAYAKRKYNQLPDFAKKGLVASKADDVQLKSLLNDGQLYYAALEKQAAKTKPAEAAAPEGLPEVKVGEAGEKIAYVEYLRALTKVEPTGRKKDTYILPSVKQWAAQPQQKKDFDEAAIGTVVKGLADLHKDNPNYVPYLPTDKTSKTLKADKYDTIKTALSDFVTTLEDTNPALKPKATDVPVAGIPKAAEVAKQQMEAMLKREGESTFKRILHDHRIDPTEFQNLLAVEAQATGQPVNPRDPAIQQSISLMRSDSTMVYTPLSDAEKSTEVGPMVMLRKTQATPDDPAPKTFQSVHVVDQGKIKPYDIAKDEGKVMGVLNNPESTEAQRQEALKTVIDKVKDVAAIENPRGELASYLQVEAPMRNLAARITPRLAGK